MLEFKCTTPLLSKQQFRFDDKGSDSFHLLYYKQLTEMLEICTARLLAENCEHAVDSTFFSFKEYYMRINQHSQT